ncbi:MAG: type transport system ATP-binding protein, partial [Actinomycetota bacterium]|nr:type transport system ATP-binding protein [Actinomycetota bacterium]
MRRIPILLVVALVTSTIALAAPNAVGAKPPLRCKTKPAAAGVGAGFRLCTGYVATQDHSESLDVDVTLPKKGSGPFPLVVYLHGLGGSKTDFELKDASDPNYVAARDGSLQSTGDRFENNNYWFASRGYAVLTYTARGFQNDKCLDSSIQSTDGKAEYGDSPACLPQLDNVNYEVKDTQYLIGRLVDRSLLSSDVGVSPRKVGVEGISYGGGQTWMLTRVNSWKSPKGTKVRVGAAVPIISWTDLLDALVPNGRARDDTVPTTDVAQRETQPVGVLKRSFVGGFHSVLQVKSQSVGTIPGYLESWYNRLTQPEPYTDAVSQDAIHKLLTERSAYFLPRKGSFETPI